jgi:hypothetical protein
MIRSFIWSKRYKCLRAGCWRGQNLHVRGRVWHKTADNCITRNFIICNLHQYNKDHYIKEDGMGGTCSKHGTGVNFMQTFTGKWERKIYLEDLGTVLKITNRFYTNGTEDCGLDLSGSAQGPVTGCCEHGNEPPVPLKSPIFFSTCQLLASKKRLRFT